MACRLFGAKPLFEPMLENWPVRTTFSEIIIEILNKLFKKNAFESVVCEVVAILSRPQCVKIELTEIVPNGTTKKRASIGSEKGVAPHMPQS